VLSGRGVLRQCPSERPIGFYAFHWKTVVSQFYMTGIFTLWSFKRSAFAVADEVVTLLLSHNNEPAILIPASSRFCYPCCTHGQTP